MNENNLTWKEFKELVEKELKENGRDENIEINYIDFSCWRPTVDIHDDNSMSIY